MTPQEQLELEILEHVYDNDEGQHRAPAALGPLFQRFGEPQARSACKSLRLRGFIDLGNSLASGYHILPEGRTVVEAMRERRNDRGHRRAECREQVLAWLDTNSDFDAGIRPGTANFTGASDLLPFTRSEVDAAIKHLKSRGLVGTIEAWGGPASFWITEAGREAIDAGGVAAAERAQQDSPVVTNTFNMAGTGNVYATATAPGATATANVSNFNLQHAQTFAAAVRAVESDLDLTDDDRADLVLIEASKPGTDMTRAQKATARLYESAGKIADGTAGGILLVLAKKALGIDG
jgi:hypothetical protein